MSASKQHDAGAVVDIDPKELIEGLQRPTTVLWIFFSWFAFTGITGLLFPEQMLDLRGVFFHDECSSGPKALILTLEQTQVLQSLFMAGLHLVVLKNGAEEAKLTSTHHMGAVRTLLLTDAVWLSLSCVWAWVFAVPSMRLHGWHHHWVLWESFLLAFLGLVAFFESRGEVVEVFGGLVQAQTNAANIKMPKPLSRNYGLMLWAIIAGFFAFVHIAMPELVLRLFFKDYLYGTCRAMSSLLVQLTGCCLLNQAMSIVAILGSSVLALHYTATRLLWVWSFGMAVFVLGTHQAYVYLGLDSSWHYASSAGFLAVALVAKHSMAEFSKVATMTRMTGRT